MTWQNYVGLAAGLSFSIWLIVNEIKQYRFRARLLQDIMKDDNSKK